MAVPERKIKILMVIDNFDQGGAQTLLLDLIESLDRTRFETVLCSLREPSAYGERIQRSGIRLIHLGRRRGVVGKFVRLLALIRRERFDIVHTHLTASRLLGVLAGWLGGAKKIFSHDHSGDEYLRKHKNVARLFLYPLDRVLMRFTDTIFAVSEATARFNVDYKKIPAGRVKVVHNWVDVERFSSVLNDGKSLRQKWGVPTDAFVVGSVGRLNPQKGFRYLIEAAPEILRHYPRICFVVIGEGGERPALENLARELNVNHAFRFPGFVAEVEKVYRGFDLFVLPSVYEPFGLVLLEAMAAEVPIVASNVGGVIEIVQEEKTGLLVPPGDADALAAVVIRLVENHDLGQRLFACAKEIVAQKFNRKLAIRRIEKIYLK